MNLTKDRFGGLLFLLVSATYGYYAADIPLLPGDKSRQYGLVVGAGAAGAGDDGA